MPVALEVQDDVDEVLEQPRPGDGAFLGDMSEQHHRTGHQPTAENAVELRDAGGAVRRAFGGDLRNGQGRGTDRPGRDAAARLGPELADGAPGLAFRAPAEPLRDLVAAFVAAE